MNSFAFCTITHGEKYLKLGDTIINQLTSLGYIFYVLTDDPVRYVGNDKVVVIKHDHPYFSFHQKRIVMRECLKNFDTAIFLDADVVLKGTPKLDVFNNAAEGLHIFASFGNIGLTFLNDDINKAEKAFYRNTKYGRAGLKLLTDLGFQYKRDFHNIGTTDYLEHFLEGKWILRKQSGKEQIFLNNWDALVGLCERMDIELGFTQNVGAGEGGAMSIAAYNSGISTYCGSALTHLINTHFISNYQEKVSGEKPWNISG